MVVEAPASSADRHDDQPSESNIIGEDDYFGGGSASIEDLFDVSGDDERSMGVDGPTPAEDQTSSPGRPGQNDQAADSDTSLEFLPAETRNKIPRGHLANPGVVASAVDLNDDRGTCFAGVLLRNSLAYIDRFTAPPEQRCSGGRTTQRAHNTAEDDRIPGPARYLRRRKFAEHSLRAVY